MRFIALIAFVFCYQNARADWACNKDGSGCCVPAQCSATVTGLRGETTTECTKSCVEFHALEAPGCADAVAVCEAGCRARCDEGQAGIMIWDPSTSTVQGALCEGLTSAQCDVKAKETFGRP